MHEKPAVNIFWFRRDLRLKDNVGLHHALCAGLPVLPVFIYDRNILDRLPDKDDARVTFIHRALTSLNSSLQAYNSSILIKYSTPLGAFKDILNDYQVSQVFANRDYDPYARQRDTEVSALLKDHNISFTTFKDHVIFQEDEIVKENGSPYTVFTPYKRKWMEAIKPGLHFKAFEISKLAGNFLTNISFSNLPLGEIGFGESKIPLPENTYKNVLTNYAETRDYPAIEGTSRIGVHLRFGTASIRELASQANLYSPVWLSELIWRDFYSMILWHFPKSAYQNFRPEFDDLTWRNNEVEFEAWCEGATGYPIVDAGMRQLKETGWMHNRVRMIVASFLCKHLLIDWRWGEAHFARRLIDYEMASNIGGWQWAAGTGTDAAPYFRIFNPDLQAKKFDPKLNYIKRWVPEFGDPFTYPQPIVEHKFARQRALNAYKSALGK